MSQPIGFVVLAKRPDIRNEGAFEFSTVSSVWPTIEPCENHQVYCQMSADRDPERYGEVEYVIASLRLHPAEQMVLHQSFEGPDITEVVNFDGTEA